MRAVVQRVERAHVDVVDPVAPGSDEPSDGPPGPAPVPRRVGTLDGPGLVVLVGVGHDDGPGQVRWMADKLAGLRLLRGDRSVLEAGAGLLLVSQFTLLGDARKGRRPTWAAAAPGGVAGPLVDALAAALRERGVTVPTGEFGADMRVHLVGDGPVTLVLDTP